nr:MAG TPA: 4Fe-4S binding domain protein [Caudoviricetes sp.]
MILTERTTRKVESTKCGCCMAACFSSMVTKSSDSEKEYYEKG